MRAIVKVDVLLDVKSVRKRTVPFLDIYFCDERLESGPCVILMMMILLLRLIISVCKFFQLNLFHATN